MKFAVPGHVPIPRKQSSSPGQQGLKGQTIEGRGGRLNSSLEGSDLSICIGAGSWPEGVALPYTPSRWRDSPLKGAVDSDRSGWFRLPLRPGIVSLLPACLLLLLTGCFPSSCGHQESRALLPADSLSRAVAQRAPVDSLKLVWQVKGPDVSLEHPRTVLFGPDSRLYVSDTKQAQVAIFSDGGQRVGEIALPEFKHPYLAGFRGDTLLVFNPDAGRIDFVQGGAVRRSVPVEVDGKKALAYAAASDSALFVKAVSEDAPTYIARLDEAGHVTRKETLDGPYWRYAGLLRMWGDSLLSFSGYRPVMDVLTPHTELDSLVLMGFDSPMLARTRLFMLGEIKQAPLLSSSAAPAGDRLFVLNMRPGWLRIDVFDHAGKLQRVLIQHHPDYDRTYFPVDLAVRFAGNGAYDIVVATAATRPSLSMYRWTPAR